MSKAHWWHNTGRASQWKTRWSLEKIINFNRTKYKVTCSGTINISICCKPTTHTLGKTKEEKYLGSLADLRIMTMKHQCDKAIKETNIILKHIRQIFLVDQKLSSTLVPAVMKRIVPLQSNQKINWLREGYIAEFPQYEWLRKHQEKLQGHI